MTKTILATAGVLIVAVMLGFAYWVGSKPPAVTSGPAPVTLPTAPGAQQTPVMADPARSYTLATNDSGLLKTLDFVAHVTTVPDPLTKGYYYLGYHVYEGVPDTTVTTDPPYIITYMSGTQFFNVSLLQEPLGTVRQMAEQYLLARLGVSPKELCRIKYTVGVPWRVSQVYASRNLGFSFCPGATQLPQ